MLPSKPSRFSWPNGCSANTCSGFVALEPVYGIVFAALLFNEPVTSWIVVSIILIIGASLILLRIEKQPLPPAV